MSELSDAYAACLALAQSHYENFPVASRLMPAALRPHVAAIYAFARTADDFADEPGRADDERLRLLAEWRARLHDSSDRTSEFLALHGIGHQARGEQAAIQVVRDTLGAGAERSQFASLAQQCADLLFAGEGLAAPRRWIVAPFDQLASGELELVDR